MIKGSRDAKRCAPALDVDATDFAAMAFERGYERRLLMEMLPAEASTDSLDVLEMPNIVKYLLGSGVLALGLFVVTARHQAMVRPGRLQGASTMIERWPGWM